MVEHLAKQVAVPPDAEVGGYAHAAHAKGIVVAVVVVSAVGLPGTHQVALYVAQTAALAAPHLKTGIGGVYVGRHAAAHVFIALYLEYHPTGAGITEVAAVAAVLMAVPYLQAGARGVEDGQMKGVAVTHAGVVEAGAVVVHGHRAVGYLVAAVTVHIGYAQIVVALSGIAGPGTLTAVGIGRARVEHPAAAQLVTVPVPGGYHGAGVVAAAEDTAGTAAVEIAHTGQVALRAVGVVVAPKGHLAALGQVGLRVEHGTGGAVEYAQVFGTVHDAPGLGVAVHIGVQIAAAHVVALGVGERGRQGVLYAVPLLPAAAGVGTLFLQAALIGGGVGFDGGHAVAPVGGAVAYHAALAVGGAVGGLHHQLGTSVTVEVVDHKLGVVGAGADVVPKVDAPQAGAVQTVAVYVHVAGKPGKRVVLGIRGLPFQEYLVLTVAVYIARAGVVGMVGVAGAVGRGAAGGLLYLDGQVALGGICT